MSTARMAKRVATSVGVVAIIVTIALTVVIALNRKSLKEKNLLPDEHVSQKIWWRVRLYARKATGGVPDLTWTDLWQMTRHPGGFGLEKFGMGVSAGGSVVNPYNTPEDHLAGGRIFIQRCARCHGIE